MYRLLRFFNTKSERTHAAAPPFPQKVTLHLHCSLVNALTTLRLATNFLQVRPRPSGIFFLPSGQKKHQSVLIDVFLFYAVFLQQRLFIY